MIGNFGFFDTQRGKGRRRSRSTVFYGTDTDIDSENPLTTRASGFRVYKLSKGMRVKCDIPVPRDVYTL